MPYIYKYVNKETEAVEYVGIIKSDSNFPGRFEQHERDPWYVKDKYDIYFSEVETQTDAEALEGHFISLYGSNKYHNKAKTGWGECSFAPLVTWKKYQPHNTIKSSQDAQRLLNRIRNQLRYLDEEVAKKGREIREAFDTLIDIEVGTKKARRLTIRRWFEDSYSLSYEYGIKKYKAHKGILFDSFKAWLESNREAAEWEFDDTEDFWDAVTDVPELARHIQGGEMYSLITKAQQKELDCQAIETLSTLFETKEAV